MEKLPKIKISFVADGNNFDLHSMTNQLEIQPTKIRTKEDWPDAIKNNPNLPKEYQPRHNWMYSKDFYEMYEFTLAYQEILSKFKSKVNILQDLANNDQIKYAIVLRIDCYEGDLPSLVVPTPMIHFLEAINAEISFDIITYKNEENEE